MLLRQIAWKLGNRSPLVASLKLTSKCSLSCIHCPWTKNQTPDISTDKWCEIISTVADCGVIQLILEGGEPTLRKDLSQIIKHGKECGVSVTIATNGMQPLNSFYPDRFLISVDGMKEVHNSIRGKGAFEILEKNILTTDIPKVALISLSKKNQHQVEEMLAYFEKKVDGFWFSFVYDYTTTNKIALGLDDRQKLSRKIISLTSKYKIINNKSFLKQVGKIKNCSPWLMSYVTADGVIHSGCFVEHLERCNCETCDLPCYGELSSFLDFRCLWDHFINHFEKKRL